MENMDLFMVSDTQIDHQSHLEMCGTQKTTKLQRKIKKKNQSKPFSADGCN